MFIIVSGLTIEQVIKNYNRGLYSLADAYQYLQAIVANGDITADEARKAYNDLKK